MADVEFAEQTDLELLRSELERTQERYYTAAHQQRQAEELLARYLNTLFPVSYAQARARRVSVVAFAEEMFKAISKVQPSEATGVDVLLGLYLETLFPAEYAEGLKQGKSLKELAEQLLSQVGQAEAPQPAAVPEPPAPVRVLDDADAISVLRFLGSSPDWEAVRRRWETETGKNEAVFAKAVETLTDKGLAELIRVPASNRVKGYYMPTLVGLTEAGRREYQERVGLAAITVDEFIGSRYKSKEAWWMIRLTWALILEANRFEQSGPFNYEVFDPQESLPTEFQKRYGNSEPDLIVVLNPRGGQTLRLCIECERALYSSTQLKSKLFKNVVDYAQAGFDGVYYIAPDRDAARLIVGTVRRLAADLRDDPGVVDRAFAAIFTVDDLAGRWLPSPSQINRWFQPRKEAREGKENEVPPEAAKPEHHLKHKGGKRDAD